jgi:hypothetical protein
MRRLGWQRWLLSATPLVSEVFGCEAVGEEGDCAVDGG